MGKSAARLLALNGANVVIVARDVGKMEGVVKDLRVCISTITE
jgi:short-subunit dehydrogenase